MTRGRDVDFNIVSRSSASNSNSADVTAAAVDFAGRAERG